MLAVATACRHVQMREGLARLAVEARQALMAVGARLFAIVATDAQIFVAQQRVGRLAQPFLHDEAVGLRIEVDRARISRLVRFDEVVHRGALGDSGLVRFSPPRPRRWHPHYTTPRPHTLPPADRHPHLPTWLFTVL